MVQIQIEGEISRSCAQQLANQLQENQTNHDIDVSRCPVMKGFLTPEESFALAAALAAILQVIVMVSRSPAKTDGDPWTYEKILAEIHDAMSMRNIKDFDIVAVEWQGLASGTDDPGVVTVKGTDGREYRVYIRRNGEKYTVAVK